MATREKRVEQHGVIEWIRLGNMAVPPHAQRELKPAKVDAILADFDLDVFGVITVSERRGVFYVIDGQHRVEAIKRWEGDGWQDLKVECRVYRGLTEAEEANKFDRLNDAMPVSIFDKFRIRVNAGRDTETNVKKIVEREKLRISKEKIPGAICAVGTLCRVYTRAGEKALAKDLRIIRDAYGDAGFEASVIDGIGHLVQRYDGLIDETIAATQLGAVHGGVKGLLNKAAIIHERVGGMRAHCVAAAAVDIINSRKGGKKLQSWWKTSASEATEQE